MDQAVRNRLRNVVTQCRKALESATAEELQGRFGIYAAGKKSEVHIEAESRMAHLSDEDRSCRQDLIAHLEHIQALGYRAVDALDQLVREIAFTHLNRLCAYKMMEARGLIRETVSRGLKSQGFLFYLADHSEDEKLFKSGREEVAYRHFLEWLGRTLSEEIGVLFNPNDSASRIYPPQRVLNEVLDLVNAEDLVGIWTKDETIGWVYQYFTPKELRDKVRKESQAPRNSYELAFRNQFFTPRYVVEFLTDNTLGRIWYEMRKGETMLKERCRHLIQQTTEIFLKEDKELPPEVQRNHKDLSQEELLKKPVYVPHRPKKDPREIKILDPACGSGHFLLYCFDLLQIIYEEAYEDPDLGPALKEIFSARDDFHRAVPGLILKHNVYGIDIDLRASQIAALALWLRCQRAYQDLGLPDDERPKITRSNIVCAEPMPGEVDLLKEFAATMQPKVLGQLVEVVFEKMKLAGEAGSLLKIEDEIQETVSIARREYQAEMRRRKDESAYFPGMAPPREATLFDFADMTDDAFLNRAEDEIVAALRQYAEQNANDKMLRRKLFAEDAALGFAFVDLCRNKYDVLLMNPPFGESCKTSKTYVFEEYDLSKYDLAATFAHRASALLAHHGLVGSVANRSIFFGQMLARWRDHQFLSNGSLRCLGDLGVGVLDGALVEAVAYVFSNTKQIADTVFFKTKHEDRPIHSLLRSMKAGTLESDVYLRNVTTFASIADFPFAYWTPSEWLRPYTGMTSLESFGFAVRQGMESSDNFRFVRLWWEVSPTCKKWRPYSKGGWFGPHWRDIDVVVNWATDGEEVKQYSASIHGTWTKQITNTDFYGRHGLCYPASRVEFSPRILPSGCIVGCKGPIIAQGQPASTVSSDSKNLYLTTLAIISSSAFRALLNMTTTSGDTMRKSYREKAVASIPTPNPTTDSSELPLQTQKIVSTIRTLEATVETCRGFLRIVPDHERSELANAIRSYRKDLDLAVCQLYGFRGPEYVAYEKTGYDDLQERCEVNRDDILSYALGCVVGRWDVRFATGQLKPPELSDPFQPFPICPPGMLQGLDGLPTVPDELPDGYPLDIDWDGILVDEREHRDDIVRRVRDVLEVIWKDRAEAVEKEACETLGVRDLRDYFRKPGNSGFWMDHVKRYSKSRRKAPIYWYLRSAKGNYGLWLYYHRLDKDTLFKALLNYVEPKIRLEEDRLNTLRTRKDAAGSSGRGAKQLEKEIDRQEQFMSELYDFEEKLRRAADLRIKPDLNDGVVLNIAPLWELVPWKEPKKYWEAVQEGKYDWSHIAYQLWPDRVEALCRKDRSVAIAHGREDLWEGKAAEAASKKRARK